MAKKYLSLEEAASMLGMSTDQVMRAREQGDLRGFADRGSWKFREQDIEEYLRSRQADSSPDIPIITGDSSSVLDDGDDDLSSSDSDVRLFFDDSPFDDGGVKELAQSGSDVRLSGDSGPKLETDAEIDLSGWDSDLKISDSDSDVKLVGAGTEAEIDLISGKKSDSDSDVRLVDDDDSDVKLFDSDSDVRLAENLAATGAMELSQSDSDSDVKLMGSDDILLDDSDSDVKLSTGLDRTDSDIRLADPSPAPKAPADVTRTMAMNIMPDDSDLKLLNKGSSTRAGSPDSGISLDVRGSGLNLNSDESGISLELDSGISLEADDSGISLESFDSGAKLGADDSGITLDAGDSGISLDLDDEGPAVQDMSRTMPMQAIPAAARAKALSDSSAMTTQFEIPAAVVGKDSEFELAGLDDDEEVGTNTSVLTFEDDDVDNSRTIAAPALADEGFADDSDSGDAEESYDDAESFDDDGGYEEDTDDVSDAEEFGDDDFESGQSQVGNFPTSARVGSRADVDWGIGIKILIGCSTVFSVLCAVIGIELVRTMWIWTQPGTEAPASAILDMIGGMF
ncbi:MAG: helix-turn-helix domain-containing protein [Planctomycetaceae bacterium]|nr:helix-turn-helix domain-containing protein [Planctomycetaceae bacterium]